MLLTKDELIHHAFGFVSDWELPITLAEFTDYVAGRRPYVGKMIEACLQRNWNTTENISVEDFWRGLGISANQYARMTRP